VLVLFFRGMGKSRGERAGAFVPGTTMPVPLIKRGANLAGCLESILHAGPPPQGAVSGPGQSLQGGTIPQGANRSHQMTSFTTLYFSLWVIFIHTDQS
jgi:hypothetical protein